MAFLDDTGMGHLWESITEYVRIRGFLHAHPVGSVYITMNSANPGDTYGGVWESVGAGRTLVGVDTGDTDFNTAQKTGGAKTVSLAHSHTVNEHTHSISHTHTVNSHSHSTGNHKLTTSEIPSHSHGEQLAMVDNNSGGNFSIRGIGSAVTGGNSGSYKLIGSPAAIYMSTTTGPLQTWNTGGGGSHNHGNTGSSSPGTGGASNSTSGSAAPETNSRLGSSNVVQPYITCYFWLRTA